MLHNAKVAAMVTFAAAADVLGSKAAKGMVERLQADIKPKS